MQIGLEIVQPEHKASLAGPPHCPRAGPLIAPFQVRAMDPLRLLLLWLVWIVTLAGFFDAWGTDATRNTDQHAHVFPSLRQQMGSKARAARFRNPNSLRNLEAGRALGPAATAAKAAARAAKLAPILADIRRSGAASLREIAAELNVRGIPAARGRVWHASQVRRILNRVSGAAE